MVLEMELWRMAANIAQGSIGLPPDVNVCGLLG